MENKPSSVEWYANASHELIVKKDSGEITYMEFRNMQRNLLYEVKAMHKEEGAKVFKKAQECAVKHDGVYFKYESFEDCYNETFGG
jgi:hypothetical protein